METRRSIGYAAVGVAWIYAGWKVLPWVAPALMPQPTWSGRPVAYVPRNLPPRSPSPIRRDGWTLRPLAEIAQRGRVLGILRYRFDRMADLVPWDVAMGWATMSDPDFLRTLTLWQDDRFMMARWSGHDPRTDQFSRSAKNVHAIPASDEVHSAIAGLRANDVVRLDGTLVDATRDSDGLRFVSSLRYDDGGAGACQVCLVRSITVERPA